MLFRLPPFIPVSLPLLRSPNILLIIPNRSPQLTSHPQLTPHHPRISNKRRRRSAVVTALRETVVDIMKEIPRNTRQPRAYRYCRQNYSQDDRSDIICFYCGRSGDAQRNCLTRQAEIPRTPTCQYCFYRGHTSDECRKRAVDMRSTSRDGSRRSNQSNERRQYSHENSSYAPSRAHREYPPPRDQRCSNAPIPGEFPTAYPTLPGTIGRASRPCPANIHSGEKERSNRSVMATTPTTAAMITNLGPQR